MNFERAPLELCFSDFFISNDIRKCNPPSLILNAENDFAAGLREFHILLVGKWQEDPEEITARLFLDLENFRAEE